MSGWHYREDNRLNGNDAQKYAERFKQLGRWRVQVFPIAQGIANVELRPMRQPFTPTIVIRTAAEAEALLASLTPAVTA